MSEELPSRTKETVLGEMPFDWDVVELRKLHTKKIGTINPTAHPDEMFEYYSIPAYQETHRPELQRGKKIMSNKLALIPRCVLFGKLNPRVEKVWLVENNHAHRLIGSTEWIAIATDPLIANPEFVYYLMWSEHVMPHAKTLVTGSTPSRQRVLPSSFYKLHVPLPSIAEQHKISSVLSSIDDVKECSERMIGSLRVLKKATINQFFRTTIEDGWSESSLNVAGQFQYGYTESASTTEVGPKFLRITDINMDSNRINWVGVPYCVLDEKSVPKYQLKENDLLFARIGATTGKTCIVSANPPNSVFASYLIRLTVTNKELHPMYVYYYTRSDAYWQQVNAGKDGKLKQGLSAGQLKDFKIIYPPYEQQVSAIALLNSIDERIIREEDYLDAINILFTSLLSTLMTGKLRVDALEV